ncbi:MAG TPA: amidohydrolase family protein [Steroidobacteraceae bacterium]|nr:amidohydrolase family protein [Steroidobacteraceae bacterium]
MNVRNTWQKTTVVLSAMFCLAVAPLFAHEVRIEHVTVVSPERAGPLRDVTVRIQDDRIVAIGRSGRPAGDSPDVEIIQGKGLYLAPGLIDSHVHSDLPGIEDAQEKANPAVARSMREQQPRSILYFGFTTIVDLIGLRETTDAWNALPVRPDRYFCGAAEIPGGYPPIQFLAEPNRRALNEYMIIQSGEESSAPEGIDPKTHTPEAVVTRMKADGAICTKTFYERGYGEVDTMRAPRLDTIRALVEAAHAAGLPVLMHANSTDGQEFAVATGVDIIAHGMWHWQREPRATELTPRATRILNDVLKANIGWQPTMQVLYGLQDLFNLRYLSDPAIAHVVPQNVIAWYGTPEGQWYRDQLAPELLPKSALDSHDPQVRWDAVRASLSAPITRNKNAIRYMVAHGARILFGTDTPSAPTYANPPGLNGWLEIQHLRDVGLTPRQIFVAATEANAKALRLDRDIGTVQPGKLANLLLLREDPTQTIQAYDGIVKVIVRGKVFDREALAADAH